MDLYNGLFLKVITSIGFLLSIYCIIENIINNAVISKSTLAFAILLISCTLYFISIKKNLLGNKIIRDIVLFGMISAAIVNQI